MRKYDFFSSKTGLSVYTGKSTKSKNGYVIESGRIFLKFFKLEKGSKAIQFMIKGTEAIKLAQDLKKLVKTKIKDKATIKSLIHKFETKQGEITTTLSIGKWKKGEKEGYQITIYRDKENFVNVPLSEVDVIYLIKLLEDWAVVIAWETTAVDEETKVVEEEIDTDTEDIKVGDEDNIDVEDDDEFGEFGELDDIDDDLVDL